MEAFTTLSHHQKSNTSAVENVEKMHQKIRSFFYIRKKKMKYTYTKPVVMLVFFALISKVLILACFKSFEKLQQEMT